MCGRYTMWPPRNVRRCAPLRFGCPAPMGDTGGDGTLLDMAPGITHVQPDLRRKEPQMNGKQIGLSLVLADFAALTGYAVYHYGVVGVFELLTANAVTVCALADLAIALTLIAFWMIRDARARGVSFVPYVILTATLGSVGPLLYLIRREAHAPEAAPHGIREAVTAR
jgi:hypothetical protein